MTSTMERPDFCFNHAGREIHFEKLFTNDCATRAIAIATGEMYWKIWQDLTFEKAKIGKRNADYSVPTAICYNYLKEIGWTAHIPEKNEPIYFTTSAFPSGTVIVEIKKHMTTIIDGVLNDTFYCVGKGRKKILRYWTKP